MISRRPIIFYENLMATYEPQITALMSAKKDYILFASDQTTTGVVDLDSLKLKQVQTDDQETAKPRKKTSAKKKASRKEKPAKVVDNQAKSVIDQQTKRKVAVTESTEATKPKSMKHVVSGLGLSLDDILAEEAQVAEKEDAHTLF